MRRILFRALAILASMAAVCSSPSVSLAQPRVHVVTVADTLSPDIAKFAETSANRVANQLQQQSPQDRLVVKRLSDKEFSREIVLRTIQQLPTNPDDAILYYYVGHGFYDNGTFFAPVADNGKYFFLREIHEALRRKGVRLIVTVSDCCSLRPKGSLGMPAPDDPRRPALFSPLLDELFLRSSGEYSINSSKPGEYALCGTFSRGSIAGESSLREMSVFSSAWMTTISRQKQQRPTWKDFIVNVRSEAISNFNDLKDPTVGKVKLGSGKYLEQDTQSTWATYDGRILIPF